MVGQNLAHYKILEKIGSGGMGAVYLAKDTKLDRNVALKILPPELAENEERRSRFTREAKAIAALNHPNIVTVYSVEEADSIHFITMEHVEGKTLAAALPRHGFSLGQFLDLAIPLVDAVAAAHEHGITHRDLKPHNIIVSAEGRVKVLDFGLAKPSARLGSAASDSELPTEQMTREGRILGTVAYMSPEQAEGKAVDARSDIFALGVNFYEMLTGERPFQGDTPASTLSAVIKDEARSMTELAPSLPRDMVRIVRRCLAKDPSRRYQTAIDVRNELEELAKALDSGETMVDPVLSGPFAFFVACAPVDSHSGGRTARCPMVERHHPDAVRRACRPSGSNVHECPSDYVGHRCRGLSNLVTGRTNAGLRIQSKRQYGHLGEANRGRTTRQPDSRQRLDRLQSQLVAERKEHRVHLPTRRPRLLRHAGTWGGATASIRHLRNASLQRASMAKRRGRVGRPRGRRHRPRDR